MALFGERPSSCAQLLIISNSAEVRITGILYSTKGAAMVA